MQEKIDIDWLWDPPLGIPEAEDIGPAIGRAEITAWEAQQGVRFPPILSRAYGQQDGGRVRGSERGVALVRLKDIRPVDVAAEIDAKASADGRFNSGHLFNLGYDDTAAALLLHLPAAEGAVPMVYFYYHDGGPYADPGIPVEDLWADGGKEK